MGAKEKTHIRTKTFCRFWTFFTVVILNKKILIKLAGYLLKQDFLQGFINIKMIYLFVGIVKDMTF